MYIIFIFIYIQNMDQVIFLIDQASFHGSQRIREYYKNNKLKVIQNAVSNPDFAPIELCFNQWKNAIRTQYYPTLEELQIAILKGAKQITKSNIFGFFRHSFSFVKK